MVRDDIAAIDGHSVRSRSFVSTINRDFFRLAMGVVASSLLRSDLGDTRSHSCRSTVAFVRSSGRETPHMLRHTEWQIRTSKGELIRPAFRWRLSPMSSRRAPWAGHQRIYLSLRLSSGRGIRLPSLDLAQYPAVTGGQGRAGSSLLDLLLVVIGEYFWQEQHPAVYSQGCVPCGRL